MCGNTSGPLNRRGTADLPSLRTLLLAFPQIASVKFLGSDRISRFISISKFSSFNSFATITSLSKVPHREDLICWYKIRSEFYELW